MPLLQHLPKPRFISPLCSLRVRNEVDLVPLACKNVATVNNKSSDQPVQLGLKNRLLG